MKEWTRLLKLTEVIEMARGGTIWHLEMEDNDWIYEDDEHEDEEDEDDEED